ncbi:MAG: hypothetical protein FJ309_14110 [Planctomycetes bacterium]|nr:hypothetical protein [Planctomycetota bacterium]
MTTIEITLPEALAKEAAEEGLLEPRAIEALLRERLASTRIARMQQARAKLASPSPMPMTAAEVEAKVKAYRAERRRASGA